MPPSPPWSYVGATGPLVWHTLKWPEWRHCAESNRQSPINLISSPATDINLVPSTATDDRPTISIPTFQSDRFFNDGHTLQVDIPDKVGGYTKFQGITYIARQFHFHTPSEHFVDGEFFPMEMHIVHEVEFGNLDLPGRFLVLGILFDITTGPSSPLIDATMQNVEMISMPGQTTTTGQLDFSEIANLFKGPSQVHCYMGSLTTPPCDPHFNRMFATKLDRPP